MLKWMPDNLCYSSASVWKGERRSASSGVAGTGDCEIQQENTTRLSHLQLHKTQTEYPQSEQHVTGHTDCTWRRRFPICHYTLCCGQTGGWVGQGLLLQWQARHTACGHHQFALQLRAHTVVSVTLRGLSHVPIWSHRKLYKAVFSNMVLAWVRISTISVIYYGLTTSTR